MKSPHSNKIFDSIWLTKLKKSQRRRSPWVGGQWQQGSQGRSQCQQKQWVGLAGSAEWSPCAHSLPPQPPTPHPLPAHTHPAGTQACGDDGGDTDMRTYRQHVISQVCMYNRTEYTCNMTQWVFLHACDYLLMCCCRIQVLIFLQQKKLAESYNINLGENTAIH